MTDPLTTINRVVAPVRAQVEDALRSAIVSGGFTPGARLIERELCERLSVSRPLLREAMRQLESEGLISRVGTRGPSVPVVSATDARQVYDVREALETMAARDFVAHAGAAERAELDAAMQALEQGVASGDMPAALRAKNAFYAVLIAGAGNPVLEQFLRTLHNRIQLLRGISLSEPGRLPQTVRELQAIHAAVAAGDGEAAEARCREHLREAARVTIQALNAAEAVREPEPAK